MSINPRFLDFAIHLSLDTVAGFYEAGDLRGLQAYVEDELTRQGSGAAPVELRPRRTTTTLASNLVGSTRA